MKHVGKSEPMAWKVEIPVGRCITIQHSYQVSARCAKPVSSFSASRTSLSVLFGSLRTKRRHHIRVKHAITKHEIKKQFHPQISSLVSLLVCSIMHLSESPILIITYESDTTGVSHLASISRRILSFFRSSISFCAHFFARTNRVALGRRTKPQTTNLGLCPSSNF